MADTNAELMYVMLIGDSNLPLSVWVYVLW